MQPKFSEGSDASALTASLAPLLSSSSSSVGGRWVLTINGEGIERSFKFKTFAKTWDFMTAVSLQCKIKNHHPEWSNIYNTTYIRWTTHNPKGLSALDVHMAALCDSIAKEFGEEPPPSAETCRLQGLANSASASAGADCCGPPKATNKAKPQ